MGFLDRLKGAQKSVAGDREVDGSSSPDDHVTVAAELPAAEPPPRRRSARFHTVRSGDTLETIAAEYGVDGAGLARLNAVPAEGVVEGQVLVIPPD